MSQEPPKIVWDGVLPEKTTGIQGSDLRVGRPVSDLPPGPDPRDVPKPDRSATVWCEHGAKGRWLVAVLTKQGRLIVDDEDLDWVEPPSNNVVVPCRLCKVDQGTRQLSVPKLRTRLARGGSRQVPLDEVLAG